MPTLYGPDGPLSPRATNLAKSRPVSTALGSAFILWKNLEGVPSEPIENLEEAKRNLRRILAMTDNPRECDCVSHGISRRNFGNVAAGDFISSCF
jgi:hypothetical protein